MGKSLPCRKGYSRMQEESENHKDIKGHGGAGSSRKKGGQSGGGWDGGENTRNRKCERGKDCNVSAEGGKQRCMWTRGKAV